MKKDASILIAVFGLVFVLTVINDVVCDDRVYRFVEKQYNRHHNIISFNDFSKENGFEWDTMYVFSSDVNYKERFGLPDLYIPIVETCIFICFKKNGKVTYYEPLYYFIDPPQKDIVYFDSITGVKGEMSIVLTSDNPNVTVKHTPPNEYRGNVYILYPQRKDFKSQSTDYQSNHDEKRGGWWGWERDYNIVAPRLSH